MKHLIKTDLIENLPDVGGGKIILTTDDNKIRVKDFINLKGKCSDTSKGYFEWKPNKLNPSDTKKEQIPINTDGEFAVMWNGELVSCYNMFSSSTLECLDKIPDTSNVTNMDGMFHNCGLLTDINTSNFNVSNVNSMESMFNSCIGLTTLDLHTFDVSKVTNMKSMFAWNLNLSTINFGDFDMSNVEYADGMFNGCGYLTTVTGSITGIKVNLNLYSCSHLTNDSAMVFINGLSSTPISDNPTISFNSSTYNTLTEEQIAIATSKGWTIYSKDDGGSN